MQNTESRVEMNYTAGKNYTFDILKDLPLLLNIMYSKYGEFKRYIYIYFYKCLSGFNLMLVLKYDIWFQFCITVH